MDVETILAGGGLVVGGGALTKLAEMAFRAWSARYQRARVEGGVDARIPQPCTVEQSALQALCRDNTRDHENLFCRVAKAEKDIARIEAKGDANFQSIQRQLDGIAAMTGQLVDRIINGRRRA